MLSKLLERAMALLARPAVQESPATLLADRHLAGRTLSRALRAELPPGDTARRLYLGALATLSAVLASWKERLRREVLSSDLYRRSGWTEIGGVLGKGWVAHAAAVLLYGGGLLAGRPRLRKAGLLVAESHAAAQAAAAILNFVVSERRPREGGQIRYFHGGGSSVSLHVTNTVVLAAVLDRGLAQLEPGENAAERRAKILGRALLWALPAVTAWQRQRSDQHYLWNVVLGAGQSFYVTGAILRAHDAEKAAK
jgi:hypothetical protein